MNISATATLTTASSNIAGNMARAQKANEESISRLASGNKFVQTATDPAGLGVSVKLKHTASVLASTETNLLNARSYLESQSAGLSAINAALQRIAEITALSRDPSKTDTEIDQSYIPEVKQLSQQIDALQSEKFNDKNLFYAATNGQAESLAVQTDSTGGSITLTQADFSTDLRWISLSGLATRSDLLSFADSGGFNDLTQAVTDMMATNGAEQSRLDFAIDRLRSKSVAFGEARSRISDVDVATEVTRLNRTSVLVQSGASMMTQANISNDLALKLLTN